MNKLSDFEQWLQDHWILCEEPEKVYKHFALSPLAWEYVERILTIVRCQLPEEFIYLSIAEDTETYLQLLVQTSDYEEAYLQTKTSIGNKVDHFFDVDAWVLYI